MQLNTSIKHHLLIGIFISIWAFIFAFFIRPFDDGTISFKIWVYISVGFAGLEFICYALVSILQRNFYQRLGKWSIGLELLTLTIFHLLFLLTTYLYYSTVLNGGYSFLRFSQEIIIKLALITTPLIFLARIYAVKFILEKENYITFRGENKLDILKIKRSDLVCVTNSQNYVEIFFTDNDQLKTKLIRSSLKKVHKDFDFMIQVHRSHLINPAHFRAWKNNDTISLTQIDLPVSKNYREHVLSL